jgi:hypothetical protein
MFPGPEERRGLIRFAVAGADFGSRSAMGLKRAQDPQRRMLRGLVALAPLALLAPMAVPTATAEATVCVFVGGIKTINETRVSFTGSCGMGSMMYFKIDDHGVVACVKEKCTLIPLKIYYEHKDGGDSGDTGPDDVIVLP